jgi:arginine/lysine/ornithine decarboxylase
MDLYVPQEEGAEPKSLIDRLDEDEGRIKGLLLDTANLAAVAVLSTVKYLDALKVASRLSWQKSQKSDPVKAVPRSVTILLGTPNRWVMSSMNFAASFDVTVATARTWIHLVNLSIATRMCL